MIDEKGLEAAARAIACRNYPSATDRDIDMMWEGYELDATAAITAYLGALEGWLLVPVELTARDMMFADMDASSAMLAAARPQIEGE